MMRRNPVIGILLVLTFSQALPLSQADTASSGYPVFPEPNYIVTGFGSQKNILNSPLLFGADNQVRFRISTRYQIIGNVSSIYGAFIGYTQNSFWNIYDPGLPFHCNDYSPELAVYYNSHSRSPYVHAWYVPSVKLFLNHESNGIAGFGKRAWDRLALRSDWGRVYQASWFGSVSFWYPLSASPNNLDIVDFCGSGEVLAGYMDADRDNRIHWGASMRSRVAWHEPGIPNVELSVYYNPFNRILPSWAHLPTLMTQLFFGRGICLLDYRKYSRGLRFGFAFL